MRSVIAECPASRQSRYCPASSPVHRRSWRDEGKRRLSALTGWQSSKVIAEGKADSAGPVEFRFNTPGGLGGLRGLWVDVGAGRKTAMHWIAPNALPLDASRGPAGPPSGS